MSLTSFFHHPDISVPVIRRRVSEELLTLVGLFAEAALTRGRSLTWNHSFPNRSAYYAAVSRLRRAGLLVDRVPGDRRRPVLALTEAGRARLPDVLQPQTFWKQRWRGSWYVLAYDIPEVDRQYRNGLRAFLSRMRMGCLQRSVWVTPRDIRPEYADLMKAAGVHTVSFLFEARTVLGRQPADIVRDAWDFRRLWQVQKWYCKVYGEVLARAIGGDLSANAAMDIAYEELAAYLSAMAHDPLLPRRLWPEDYCGPSVYQLHRKLVAELGQCL